MGLTVLSLQDAIRAADPQGLLPHPIKKYDYPDWLFEYHPLSGIVYQIRKYEKPLRGRIIAVNLKDEGEAWTAVTIFCRGVYEERRRSGSEQHRDEDNYEQG